MGTAYKPLGSIVPGSTRLALFISNKALTSNVATLTTNAVHGLTLGDVVEIAGVDTVFDGTYVVATTPTTTKFTYARTNANVASAAVTIAAPAWRNHNLTGAWASNKLAVNGLVTLTIPGGHGLSVKDWFYVSVGDTVIDGLRQVYSTPSGTLVSFRVAGASIASTALGASGAGGAIGKASSNWATLFGPVSAATSEVVSTIAICNGHDAAANVRIALSTTTSPTRAERIVQDTSIAVGDTIFLTIGLTADTGKYLMVQSNQPDVTFSASAGEIT
jgi:hypothetical protein